MKHILVVIVMMFASTYTWAQDGVKSEGGFKWYFDAQINFGSTFQTGPGAIVGYSFNHHVFLGVGADIFLETYDGMSFPLYWDSRFTLHKEESSPVIDFRVGCDIRVNCESLLMASAAYGYRIALDKVAITPLIGVKIADDYGVVTSGITIELK